MQTRVKSTDTILVFRAQPYIIIACVSIQWLIWQASRYKASKQARASQRATRRRDYRWRFVGLLASSVDSTTFPTQGCQLFRVCVRLLFLPRRGIYARAADTCRGSTRPTATTTTCRRIDNLLWICSFIVNFLSIFCVQLKLK